MNRNHPADDKQLEIMTGNYETKWYDWVYLH